MLSVAMAAHLIGEFFLDGERPTMFSEQRTSAEGIRLLRHAGCTRIPRNVRDRERERERERDSHTHTRSQESNRLVTSLLGPLNLALTLMPNGAESSRGRPDGSPNSVGRADGRHSTNSSYPGGYHQSTATGWDACVVGQAWRLRQAPARQRMVGPWVFSGWWGGDGWRGAHHGVRLRPTPNYLRISTEEVYGRFDAELLARGKSNAYRATVSRDAAVQLSMKEQFLDALEIRLPMAEPSFWREGSSILDIG